MSGALGGQALVAALCLGAVVLLILGIARAARTLPALRLAGQSAGGLVLGGSLALDRQRRLHLIDVGGCQALVLTGGGTDVMTILPGKV